jgi:uncharacterized protein YndB with AHSA1/START domain
MNISPNKLVIRRLLKHDRAQVFSALTDPAKMAKWFYGMETGQAKVTSDLRPGGNFEIEMLSENGEEECKPHGIYLEIVPLERVVFTWTSEGSVKDTRVAIELFERDGGTELVLTHELPADTIEPHRQGWTNCLIHLEDLLSSGTKG